MKLQVFAIYDAAAEAYMRPVFDVSVGAALRSFADECNREDSMLHKHPEHFTLFHLGEWDDANAKMNSLEPHRSLVKAVEVVTV